MRWINLTGWVVYNAPARKHQQAGAMKMKPPPQLKRLGIKDHSCHRQSAKLLTAGLILVFALVNSDAGAERLGACRLTANTVLRSCRDAAQSDYWLALAKCDNLADPAAGLPDAGIGGSERRAADLQGTKRRAAGSVRVAGRSTIRSGDQSFEFRRSDRQSLLPFNAGHDLHLRGSDRPGF